MGIGVLVCRAEEWNPQTLRVANKYDLLKRRKVQSSQHRHWERVRSHTKVGLTVVFISFLKSHYFYSINLKVKIFNIFMASLDSWIKSPHFFMPFGHFNMVQMCRFKINDYHLLKHMEQNLITALPWIWVLMVFRLKDTFQEFRATEWGAYWKQNWGVRALYWLHSNFYLNLLPLEMETLTDIIRKEERWPIWLLKLCRGVIKGWQLGLHQWDDLVNLSVSS